MRMRWFDVLITQYDAFKHPESCNVFSLSSTLIKEELHMFQNSEETNATGAPQPNITRVTIDELAEQVSWFAQNLS